ncbi:multicopper oxidase family protein [Streptomyces flavochromogenes]|uniref:Multicopper oxidase family protein n=1 Tax=Streptomyces flavochromogenes TaxID=68199 RepID=A0ABW6XYG9_9ACTN
MSIPRRTLIRVLGGSALALPVLGGAASWAGHRVDTWGKVSFDRPLDVPPLAPSRVDGQGQRVFDLTIAAGRTEFTPGRPSATWGVNGGHLGPTLRARRGEKVRINVDNRLPEATSLHWHGMHLPPSMDGGPHQMIEPGTTWSPFWTVRQQAATLWYHPHPHGRTAQHVYRGVAGMFLIDDDAAPHELPHAYGIDDIPLIVQDRRLPGGVLDPDEPMAGTTGFLGDRILVNGTLGPYLDVRSQRVRLRLLNGSNARVFRFHLADHRAFELVATDGGLLPAPHTTDHVQLSPGERAEIVVTLTPGERAVLRSSDPDTGAGFVQRDGGEDRFDVLQLRAAATLASSARLPARLADVPRIPAHTADDRRVFELAEHTINGRRMSPDRIDLTVRKDTTEIWEVHSGDGTLHSFHVHDVHFQVLTVDGRTPPAHLAGWKDTVLLPPGTSMRLIMRFADYADPGSPYMYHCHMLYHEDRGMMGRFMVVEAGGRPDPPAAHHSGHH